MKNVIAILNRCTSMLFDNVAFVLALLVICILFVIIFILFSKIRALKEEIHDYSNLEEKYQKVMELSDDIIFEYNIRTDIMHNSEKYTEIFGRNPVIYNYTEAFVEEPYVHTEDIPMFKEYCNSLHIGKSQFSYEFRLMNSQNEYEWCSISGRSYSETEGLPDKVVGRIINIDAQKTEYDRLQFKAQRDLMTNVFNKNTAKEKINELINKSKKYERHALFVIDIDDFKHVNDTYGHLQGDYVLTTIVSNVAKGFREEDVIGRIGGDEFVALMKNVTSREQIIHKAEKICKAFNRTFHYSGEKIQVSCSIGVAVYPMDGGNYDELVDHADLALYEVKADGKNSYMLYCDL